MQSDALKVTCNCFSTTSTMWFQRFESNDSLPKRSRTRRRQALSRETWGPRGNHWLGKPCRILGNIIYRHLVSNHDCRECAEHFRLKEFNPQQLIHYVSNINFKCTDCKDRQSWKLSNQQSLKIYLTIRLSIWICRIKSKEAPTKNIAVCNYECALENEGLAQIPRRLAYPPSWVAETAGVESKLPRICNRAIP